MKLRTAIESSSENAEAAQRVQKLYYDRKSRARKSSVGDKVILMQPSSTSKMLAQYVGPYEITRCLDFDNYEVELERRKTVLHINVLKLYIDRADSMSGVYMERASDDAEVVSGVLIAEADENEEEVIDLEEETKIQYWRSFRRVVKATAARSVRKLSKGIRRHPGKNRPNRVQN